jgi:perosamine synthetase
MKNQKLVIKILENIKKVTGKKKVALHEPVFWSDEKRQLTKCINSTFVSTAGKFVGLFEKKIKKYTKSSYVLATNSGTSALHICFIVSGVKNNDEVLIPALNFVASSNAAIYCGAIPHFVDTEEETLSINPEKLYDYLVKITYKKGKHFYNKKTKRRIKAIVPTHIFGHSGNLETLLKIANRFNLVFIEDASEAVGSFYKKKHLGTFGLAGALSFNGNKILTTGSGGAILLKKKKDFIKAKKLISVSKIKHKWNLIYDGIGYNYKMSNIQAALGCAQFDKLEKIINLKYKLLKKYKKAFEKLPEARVFELNNFRRSNYWLQTLILSNNFIKIRDKILKKANDQKIMLRPAWKLTSTLSHLNKYPRMDLTTSIKLQKTIINLPSSIYSQ